MLLLEGAVLALLGQLFKWLITKFDKKVITWIIYVFLFVVALGWTYLVRVGVISAEMIQYWITLVGTATLTYELILKRIKPILTHE